MTIRIAKGLELPPDVVTQAIAILARRGAGKTYTGSVLVEEVVKAKLPVVILDPTGAWWGLRTSADGERPGLPVVIFGGEHGDVPLDAHAGKVIADVVIEHPGAYVIDLSGFESKGAEQRFAGDFLERLYRGKATRREAFLLVVDEADLLAPQRPGPEQTRTLGALEAIVRRGRIRAAVAGDRLAALYLVTLAAGLRQAEVLGLRWSDVDLEAGMLRVAVVLDRVDGRYVLTEPKTRRSRRTVALPAFALEALRAHRAAQLLERVAAGQATEEGLVFVTEPGRPISAGWLSHRWPKIAAAAGLAGVTFHDLRHGQASLLVAAGVHPRVVQERLGHATVAMSMDVYSHVASAADRDAADRLQAAIG